jgi:hypothetical protein
MHDIFEPQDPPARNEIPIFSASDRIGSPICVIDPKKIAGIVYTNLADESSGFDEGTPVTDQIGQNVANFLRRPKCVPAESRFSSCRFSRAWAILPMRCSLRSDRAIPISRLRDVYRSAAGFGRPAARKRPLHVRLDVRTDAEPEAMARVTGNMDYLQEAS